MRNEEHQLQVTIVKYLRYKKYVVFSIPNHGVRSPRMGAYYKEEGLLPGVADLFLMLPNKHSHGVFIEVKSKEGRMVETQKQFQIKCIQNDYEYWLIKDLDTLIKKISQYELNI